jgi:hypothetical protein
MSIIAAHTPSTPKFRWTSYFYLRSRLRSVYPLMIEVMCKYSVMMDFFSDQLLDSTSAVAVQLNRGPFRGETVHSLTDSQY